MKRRMRKYMGLLGQRRRGAAIVELAIVLPFLLLMVLGIIEFGQIAYVRHVLINAATQGARASILPGATEETIEAVTRRSIDVTSLGRVGSVVFDHESEVFPDLGETVTVSVPYKDVSLVGGFFGDFQLTSAATMFRGPLDE